MKMLKMLAAAAVVAVPALLGTAPADALTSRQYQAQGHGRYLNSSGSRTMSHGFFRGHHRHHRHFRRHHRHHG